jgi:hypothetical protein
VTSLPGSSTSFSNRSSSWPWPAELSPYLQAIKIRLFLETREVSARGALVESLRGLDLAAVLGHLQDLLPPQLPPRSRGPRAAAWRRRSSSSSPRSTRTSSKLLSRRDPLQDRRGEDGRADPASRRQRSSANRFYPHIAGVAQSFNYYPVSYLKPEDGVAVIGLGLGLYVVDGEQAWRFCPKHPRIDFLGQEDVVRSSQDHFYAIDMSHDHAGILEGTGANLLSLPIGQAEKDGAAAQAISVWDPHDRVLAGGGGAQGAARRQLRLDPQTRPLPAGAGDRQRARGRQVLDGDAGADRVRGGSLPRARKRSRPSTCCRSSR